MTAADADARALVLHQFLALRRAGLSSLDALNRLVEALPEGPLRTACRDAALALSASTPESPVRDTGSGDDLVRVLSERSDDLSLAATLAESFQAAAELAAARRSGTLVAQLVVAVPLVGLALMGLFSDHLTSLWSGAELPAPTRLLLELLEVLKYAGLPLAVGLVLLLTRWKAPVFGASTLEASQQLFRASSLHEPMQAVSAARLDQVARAVVLALVQRAPPEDARGVVAQVARRLEREGRRRVELHHLMSSLLLAFFGVFSAATVMLALYLPLFSIAGAIK